MLCPKCGNQINDNAKLCDACGFSINSLSVNNKGGLLSRRKRKSEELDNNDGKISESGSDINQSNNISNNESNINIVEDVKIVQSNKTVDFSKIKKK
ncbi:zinc ribbon domain-containing protein [Brachyspira catarrhinii]|uniref:Zinc ribbon domain-containing protein n=1 Tax=Brachyspira catarrhinii TaxID=2528966 RepID=A0ABY2TQG9_9SPIR|nr:zinc ribbon domain-containing protein [Brachyspira catarrhinii]TKZ33627.1 zinc ribbon domain-containing protein [Brachyspira catarrhinii]